MIHDTRPFGQLASAALAVSLAMRLRGRKDDLEWARLLDRLGRQVQMYLAGEAGRGATSDAMVVDGAVTSAADLRT